MDSVGVFSLFLQGYCIAVATLIFVGLLVLLSLVVGICKEERGERDT